MTPDKDRPVTASRLAKAVDTAARLVEIDPIYLPIFARLDSELSEALRTQSPVEYARAKVRMQAMVVA